jgi:hypothetical protein
MRGILVAKMDEAGSNAFLFESSVINNNAINKIGD